MPNRLLTPREMANSVLRSLDEHDAWDGLEEWMRASPMWNCDGLPKGFLKELRQKALENSKRPEGAAGNSNIRPDS